MIEKMRDWLLECTQGMEEINSFSEERIIESYKMISLFYYEHPEAHSFVRKPPISIHEIQDYCILENDAKTQYPL